MAKGHEIKNNSLILHVEFELLEESQQFIGTTSKFHNNKVHMIKRWLPAHTPWGMSTGGIRQYHVGEWNPWCRSVVYQECSLPLFQSILKRDNKRSKINEQKTRDICRKCRTIKTHALRLPPIGDCARLEVARITPIRAARQPETCSHNPYESTATVRK